jgi:hypothetical protein
VKKRFTLSQAKRELERRANDAPWIDEDGVEWTLETCTVASACAHCDEPLQQHERALHSTTGDWLHRGCWDGHVGFAHAMSRDD